MELTEEILHLVARVVALFQGRSQPEPKHEAKKVKLDEAGYSRFVELSTAASINIKLQTISDDDFNFVNNQ